MRTTGLPWPGRSARRLALCLLSGFLATPSHAILDTNNNGMSDLWEKTYNNSQLFPGSSDYLPGADPDGDGWTNEQEATAGTNPFLANPPDGMVQTQITHIPATYYSAGPGDPELLTPETFSLVWPTLPGKQYTLSFSPDLTAGSWTPVGQTFIATGTESTVYIPVTQLDGSAPEKLFWRVSIHDIDSDGDGLTDREEYLLGTNPNNAQTLPGYDDHWLAVNFTDLLLNRQLDMIDTDGDGLTNAQEALLGTNPDVPDNPGIVQESISNGTFSQPVIGTGARAGTTPPIVWDYWSGVAGWTALGGQNIEYQTITPVDAGNQYCELKAHPEGHNGIKQKIGTRKDVTYLLVLQCKDRADTAPTNSNFDILIDGTSVRSITFDAHGPWITRSVAFKAANVITELAFSPTTAAGTRGCLVDNIRIAPVAIEDNVEATGVDAVSITADTNDQGYQDKFWIMAPSGNDPNGDPCANLMKFKIPLNPSADLDISCPNAQADPATVTLAASQEAGSTWKSTATATNDESPTFKVGPDTDTLPIGVKTIKRRTVKVAVHRVASAVPGRPVDPPDLLPADASAITQIKARLDQTFGYQVNAYFDVTVLPQENINFDVQDVNGPNGLKFFPSPIPGNRTIDHNNWVSGETALICASRPSGYDIHVYVVGGGSPIRKFERSSQDLTMLMRNNDIDIGITAPSDSICMIDGDRDGKDESGIFVVPEAKRTSDAVVETIVHEIGHVIIGDGHPDEGDGRAPLLGTDRARRLMCSGPNRAPDAKLLVKKEWDKAEVWLKDRPRGDN